jgi:uncharacterized Zn-finger protein
MEVGHPSYSEFAAQKGYHSGALDPILNNKLQKRKFKGSHSAIFKGVDLKLYCSKFNMEVGHPSYSEFAAQKGYHSGALNQILNNKLQKRKFKGSHAAIFKGVDLKLYCSKFNMDVGHPSYTVNLPPKKDITLGH